MMLNCAGEGRGRWMIGRWEMLGVDGDVGLISVGETFGVRVVSEALSSSCSSIVSSSRDSSSSMGRVILGQKAHCVRNTISLQPISTSLHYKSPYAGKDSLDWNSPPNPSTRNNQTNIRFPPHHPFRQLLPLFTRLPIDQLRNNETHRHPTFTRWIR